MSESHGIVYESTPAKVSLVSEHKPFNLDTFLSIETDEGPIVCRIVETFEKSVHTLSEGLKEEIRMQGIQANKLFFAEGKVEQARDMPVPLYQKGTPLSPIQIKALLTPTPLNEGLVLGEINGTKDCYPSSDKMYQSLLTMLKDGAYNQQEQLPFLLNLYDFYKFPHVGLFGGSGSGKSYALNVLLEELLVKKMPTIVLDPHFEMTFDKMNEAVTACQKEKPNPFKSSCETFIVGQTIGICFTDLSTDELCSLILFKGDLSQPMLSLIKEVHTKGDTITLVKNHLNVLSRFKELEDNKEKIDRSTCDPKELGYYESMRSKIPSLATLKALEWRFDSLVQEAIFDGDIRQAERAIKERKTIILRGTLSHLNMLSSYLIKSFYRKRRQFVDAKMLKSSGAEPFPPFFIAMDEAHHFAPNGTSLSPTKSILKTISQEGRKYGVFEIIASQRPQLLDETLVAQLSTKIILRTNISQDLEVIRRETNLNEEEIGRLPYLDSGNAFVSSAITKNTISIRFRANLTMPKTAGHPFDDLALFETSNPLTDYLLTKLPLATDRIETLLPDAQSRFEGITRMKLIDHLSYMHEMDLIVKDKSPFGSIYDKKG